MIDELRLLFRYRMKIFLAALTDFRPKQLIQKGAMAFLLFVLLFGGYRFFLRMFLYVAQLEDIGYLLINRLISVGFFSFFVLLILSNFVISLSTLYRSPETEYLFSTPISTHVVFLVKLIDNILFSGWAILLMGLPILMAYGKVRGFSMGIYVYLFCFMFLPFVLIPSFIGVFFSLIAFRYARKLRMSTVAFLAAGGFVLLIFLLIKTARPTGFQVAFTEDFRALNLFINNLRVNAHPFTPNFWFASSLQSFATERYNLLLLYSLSLVATCLFLGRLLWIIGKRMYYSTWVVSSESLILFRQRAFTGTVRTPLTYFFKGISRSLQALILKDIKLFIRTPKQWAQFLLLLSLLIIYLYFLSFIPQFIEIETWRTIIALINFGFSGYILATLTVRFAFPSISLEGRSFWVLGSAPLNLKKLFLEKLGFFSLIFLLIAEATTMVSSWLLGIYEIYGLFTYISIFFMSIVLCSLAVGLGAIFPDFTETNPAKIASSAGGVFCVVASLLYVGVMVAIIALPASRYTMYLVMGTEFPGVEIIASIIFLIFWNILYLLIPLRLGLKAISQREF